MNLKEYRKLLKDNHLCRECKAQDAYTLNGHSRCFECSQKENERARKTRANNPEHEKKLARARRETALEKGLCTNCRKRTPKAGHKQCSVCINAANKKRNIERQMRIAQARYLHLCSICKEEPVYKDKRVCKACYDKCIAKVRVMNEINKKQRASA